MNILPDCHVCAMRQALGAARLVSDDPAYHHRVLREAARMLAECPLDVTPPEAGEGLYRMIRETSGNPDPFAEMKRAQNQAVMDILPWLRETVATADDPLLMAVRLAIAGNTVDPGAQASFDLEKSVTEAISGERVLENFPAFAERLRGATSVLVPSHVDRTITVGVQRVADGGAQSGFVTAPIVLPALSP